jgi:DNA helicase HerA-like ATPase
MANPLYIGKAEDSVTLDPKYGNRHGLITGATGTGKTVTLQILAEAFSAIGTPVFMSDVKGDVSGMCMPGGGNPKLEQRAKDIGLDPYSYAAAPIIYWDLFGENGHRLRATISEMGPLLLTQLLQLNDTQEGVLNIAFKIADERGLLLLDLKDLRAILGFVAENAKEIQREYGLVSETSVGAIQRSLLVLEQQGADNFFGEPALNLDDFMRTTSDGRGYINLLCADKLMNNPRLYATFLLWLLSELFERLPEVGDPEQPKLVFFFDEAHLLFNDAPKALIEKVEQVVRLIRSKGVGVYFCSQNPLDVPDSVLAQLGNRVQHALRAYTPRDQKAVNAAAETFRPNPAFKTADVITQLGVGEALVSVLQEKGVPSVVQRTLIRPPASRLGPATPEERRTCIAASPIGTKYEQQIDRESAYEVLRGKTEHAAPPPVANDDLGGVHLPSSGPSIEYSDPEPAPRREPRTAPQRRSDSPFEATIKSVLRSAGSSLGREITRGILGGIFRRR